MVFIILPVSVQIWAYACVSRVVSVDIFHHFRVRGSESRSRSTHDNKRSSLDEFPRHRVNTALDMVRYKRRSRLVKLAIILVVVFQLCYIPRGILMMIREFGDFSESLAFIYIDMVALILYYMKHVLNPLIIFTSSSVFRIRLKRAYKAKVRVN